MSRRRRTLTSALLLFFAVWDAILAAATLLFPEQWFEIFHDADHVDPQALLARTGAIWAAFALFHLLAFLLWRRRPYWLVIVGGMRLGEIFADVTYLLLADSVTTTGRIALLLAAPSNVIFALFFIRGFLLEARAAPEGRESRSPAPVG